MLSDLLERKLNQYLILVTIHTKFCVFPSSYNFDFIRFELDLADTFSGFIELGLYPLNSPKSGLILHTPAIPLKRYIEGSNFHKSSPLSRRTVLVSAI